jgi:hypothetical protein
MTAPQTRTAPPPQWVQDVIEMSALVVPLFGITSGILLAFTHPSFLAIVPLSLAWTGVVLTGSGTVSASFAARWAVAMASLIVVLLLLSHALDEWSPRADALLVPILLSISILLVGVPVGVGMAIGAVRLVWIMGPRALTALTVYVALLALGGGVYRTEWRLPSGHSDDAMISHFRARQPHLEQLVFLIKKDGGPFRNDSCLYSGPEHVAEPRRTEYSRLLADAGVKDWSRCGNRVLLRFWGSDGLFGAGISKGFAYSTEPLETTLQPLEGDAFGHKSLDQSWYIYRMRRPGYD